jgi:hypothetical protein
MGKPYADNLKKSVAVRLIGEGHGAVRDKPEHDRPLPSAISHNRQRSAGQVWRPNGLFAGEACRSDQTMDRQAAGSDVAGDPGPPRQSIHKSAERRGRHSAARADRGCILSRCVSSLRCHV